MAQFGHRSIPRIVIDVERIEIDPTSGQVLERHRGDRAAPGIGIDDREGTRQLLELCRGLDVVAARAEPDKLSVAKYPFDLGQKAGAGTHVSAWVGHKSAVLHSSARSPKR